jgi:hypothetical protein
MKPERKQSNKAFKRSVTAILKPAEFKTCLDKFNYCPAEFDEEQLSTGLSDDQFIPKSSPTGNLTGL